MQDNLLAAMADPTLAHTRALLDRLGEVSPQSILLEGGTETQRLAMAYYWAACCNCPQILDGQKHSPCLNCAVCRQIAAREYLDVSAYDGRIGNTEDEANPGVIRALNMKNLRALRRQIRDTPRGNGKRVVLLMGMTQKRTEAANALLKALEEPSPSTRFVLLVSQREQLLPTLVSRSFCLTLPWPDTQAPPPDMEQWEDALADFLKTGQMFLDKVSSRKTMDADIAQTFLLACQKSLLRALAGKTASPLDSTLAVLDAQGKGACGRWLNEAQEMLRYQVTPGIVLQALAMRLFVLVKGCRRF